MITFKQQFTFNEEAVKGFAIYLGWEEDENTESFIDFVNNKAREHSLKFTKAWAEKLKQDYINQTVKENIEPQLYQQIVKPVEDALINEVILSN